MSITRRVAALAALTLSTTGLAGLAAQPASAADDATLSWGVSQYLNEHLETQSFTDGATESPDGVVTFTGGVKTGDTTKYQGAASYSFRGLYSFTFSDLALTVDGEGNGTIAADVDWTSPAPGAAEDIVLTTFSTTDDWADGALTGTPDWLGVAPADAYGSGKPVNGASWAVDFVNALPSSINPTFYASGSNPASDAKKFPASFTATGIADQSGPTVAAVTSYEGRQLLVDVDGSGFTAVTQPGDQGVYVGLAPAGDFPDTADMNNPAIVGEVWIQADQMADGTFSVRLDPENDELDPSQQYAVFTWQAHGHSNPSQDTQTPVEIIWSNLAGPTTLTAKVAKAPTTKKAGKLTAKVTGDDTAARGNVTVVLTKKGEKTKRLTGKVVDGAAAVKLPKLAKGTWKAKVQFLPKTAAYKSATKTVSVKVTK